MLPDFLIIVLVAIFSACFVYQLFLSRLNWVSLVGLFALTSFLYFQYIGSPYGFTAFLFLVGGITFIVAEFFVPGGILGIIGMSGFFYSFFLIIEDLYLAWATLVTSIFIGIFVFVIQHKVLKKRVALYKTLMLTDSLTSEEGYISQTIHTDLLGKSGVTVTDFRPAGKVNVAGISYDAVTDGQFLDRGMGVKVIHVEGMRIVVEKNVEPGQ